VCCDFLDHAWRGDNEGLANDILRIILGDDSQSDDQSNGTRVLQNGLDLKDRVGNFIT